MNNRANYAIIIPTGLMLFSFFFGAGNLIFPPTLGQQSGSNFIAATLGFCSTGVGLPLLGILAVALTGSDNPDTVSQPVSKKFARFITILSALTIGPFFAIPRTAATSYDMGIAALLPEGIGAVGLLGYSVFFFALTYILALNRSKLVDNIGKVITPMLLISFVLLVGCVIFKPMGAMQPAVGDYVNYPFLKGFQEGYNTMDLLCSLIFGAAIAQAIKDQGITETKDFFKVFVLSGLVAGACLGLIYAALTYTGASSVAVLGHVESGGKLLNLIAVHYMGAIGKIVLAILIFSACITTSIGLNVAIAEYFSSISEKISYKAAVTAMCLFSLCVANFGLTAIIKLSIPVIYFLYPILIALVLLNVGRALVKNDSRVFKWCVGLTTVFALLDGIKAAGLMSATADSFLAAYIPMYTIGFGWLCPCLLGLVIGFAVKKA